MTPVTFASPGTAANDAAAAAPLTRDGDHGAFVRDGDGHVPRVDVTSDRLAGLRLAVKDVFDVEGLRTGCGNPAWRDAQPVAARTAIAVERLLAAGASWTGRTVTDELTYSLAGINAHYGTPRNPASVDRIPGGSSSGSVVAVAAGLADLALGTDCGGSVRLPASYCGVWGLRPTHGRIASRGCFTLAHSFDTVGAFARDPETLTAAFDVLAGTRTPLDAGPEGGSDDGVQVSTTVAGLLDPAVRNAWDTALRAGAFGRAMPVARADEAALRLADWAAAFRTLQAAEIALQHGAWAAAHGHTLGDDVRLRFEAAARIGAADAAAAQRVRVQAGTVMARLLAPGRVLLLPTVPSPAPRRDDSAARIDDVRQRAQQLLCMAGLAGLPQVSFPWTSIDGAPVGLSVIGARGDDETVLRAARRVHRRLLTPLHPTTT